MHPLGTPIVVTVDEFVRLKPSLGRVVAVSGGFDPLHSGHLELFSEAKKLGDTLVVILNNDHWLAKKKGAAFMSEAQRAQIICALRMVDGVVLSEHPEDPLDMSISSELERIRPHVFANGGDRRDRETVPEWQVCEDYGIEFITGIGGEKRWSSSSLLKNWHDFFSSRPGT